MRPKARWKYVVGVMPVLAVAALLLVVFSLICIADRTDAFLMDTRAQRFGWRYELLVDGELRAYEPVFSDEYMLSMPEGTQAVRISRTMTEEIPNAELEWSFAAQGVEVFLNGRLLHSSFQGTERDANGFLRSAGEEAQRILEDHERNPRWEKVRMSLPANYLGGELSVITYFPEGWENPQPEYPTLGNSDSALAPFVVETVLPVSAMVVCAILTLLLAGIYLVDLFNGRADGRTLLLCLYFALLFLDEAYGSSPGYYSVLGERLNLKFLSGLYVAPLCLYLALRLKEKWKYPLCAGAIGWALYEGTRMFLNVRSGFHALEGRSGLGSFVLLMCVAAAMIFEELSRREGRKRAAARAEYVCVAVTVTAVCLLNRVRGWGSLGAYLKDGLFSNLQAGYFMPTVDLIANISSMMATIVLVVEFIRRTLHLRQERSALRERARQTMESYNRLLEAQEATSALRHEMRHHLTALSGLLRDGDVKRASRYVSAIAGALDQLPAGRYSQNLLVNVIAGSYLDRARAQWIRVEHRLNVPPELRIADEDLSVFLSNMLQNALEACEQMDPASDRYIQVEMRLRGRFLFIKCVNSAPEESGSAHGRRNPGHGYGLAAMHRIAEKYDSMLLVERAPGEFTVKSDLCLKRGEESSDT